ncbi:MAG: hypothetical protein QM645_08530 [Asticcacaulis sp.]
MARSQLINFAWGLQLKTNRYENIREEIDIYYNKLIELYEHTDPKHGDNSEINKLYYSRKAYEIWWYMHDKLMLWAQSHLFAYHQMRENPELIDKFETITQDELTENSHYLEFLGSHYSFNVPDEQHEIYIYTGDFLTQNDYEIQESTYRSFLNETLTSRSANSSFWRFDLIEALTALNEGEVMELLSPVPLKRQGKAFSLRRWKLACVKKVYFEYGSGLKKYAALTKAANIIGVSTETIRSWDKELRLNDNAAFEIECARLAGKLSLLSEHEYEIAKNDIQYKEVHGLMSYFDMANHILVTNSNKSYEKIRDKINEYRSKDENGET